MTDRILFADVGNTLVKWRLWADGSWLPVSSQDLRAAIEGAESLLTHASPWALVVVPSAPGEAIVSFYPTLRRGDGPPPDRQAPETVWVAAQLARVAEEASMPCLLAGYDLPIPMPTAYQDAGELGLDRLCVAFAASRLIGTPVVTASAGTCITVEAVDACGVLAGGAIAAGVGAMARGIGESVPHLYAAVEDALGADPSGLRVGRSTAENLAVGIWLGAAALLDGLIAAARGLVGMEAPVVLTGGDAHKLAPLCCTKVQVFDHLVLEGLRLAYEIHLARRLSQ